jgi:hypothetical protein
LDYVENKTDENLPLLVIPAEAGIYSLDLTLDSRFRGNDTFIFIVHG